MNAIASARASRPRLLWVAAEAAPYASTGGLAEVAGALPPRLHAAGWPIALLLPYYREMIIGGTSPAIQARRPLPLELGTRRLDAELLGAEGKNGLPLFLLACDELFDRDGLYGEDGIDYDDNALRFGALSLAACELVRQDLWPAELLHLNDWHAALAAVFLATRFRDDPVLSRVRTLLSIHNLAHQGVFPPDHLTDLGLPQSLASFDLMGHHDGVSWLKGGILFADRLSTVSPRYAKEILSPKEGRGLDSLLLERAENLGGILNGIDVDEWDPNTDPYLADNFSAENMGGKAACKTALLAEYGLEGVGDSPVVGFVSRLVPQKGVDLLLAAASGLLAKGAVLVIMGSGDLRLEEGLSELAQKHPGRVGLFLGYDRPRVHRILAGSDILIMPSRFEPCGLTQMQAMRYGAIPVVHAVGGLADTVKGVTASALAAGKGNGFVFRKPTTRALTMAVGKAIELYHEPSEWARLVNRVMLEDWSWDRGLGGYERIYRKAMTEPVHRFGIDVPEGPSMEAEPAPFVEPQPYIDWGPELPYRYGEDTIRLMVQSPRQMYVYWELSPARFEELGGWPQLSLRLLGDGGPSVLADGLGDVGDWWIASEPFCHYRVELLDGGGRVLLSSNEVHTPRDRKSDRGDVQWMAAELRLQKLVEARRRRELGGAYAGANGYGDISAEHDASGRGELDELDDAAFAAQGSSEQRVGYLRAVARSRRGKS